MEGLVEGRIVHFVLDDADFENIICRPAIIVNAWNGKLEDEKINIQVFLDGGNDDKYLNEIHDCLGIIHTNLSIHRFTSIPYSESREVGTWHWPERN